MDAAKEQAKKIHKDLDSNAEVTTFQKAGNAVADGVKELVNTLWREGYVILPNLLSQEQLVAVRRAVDAQGAGKGRNRFEGRNTERLYGILGKGTRAFDALAEHPTILALNDAVLQPNYLLTASQSIEIGPGEPHQPYHYDDAFCLVPRPRQPFSTAVIYAIDDFTPSNGATLIFPRSHLWGDQIPRPGFDVPMPAIMPAGSAIFFLSTLWHGGGANSSSGSRLAVTFQYCEPYMRPQENMFLSVPFAHLSQMSPRLVSMLGYSIHPPFVGHSNGHHPLKAVNSILKSKL